MCAYIYVVLGLGLNEGGLGAVLNTGIYFCRQAIYAMNWIPIIIIHTDGDCLWNYLRRTSSSSSKKDKCSSCRPSHVPSFVYMDVCLLSFDKRIGGQ